MQSCFASCFHASLIFTGTKILPCHHDLAIFIIGMFLISSTSYTFIHIQKGGFVCPKRGSYIIGVVSTNFQNSMDKVRGPHLVMSSDRSQVG